MNFYDTLPEGYLQDKVIDAKGKLGLILNLIAVAVWFVIISVALAIRKIDFFEIDLGLNLIFYMLGFFAAYVIYIIAHELTHGLFYKIFTHKKLTFGFTLTVAYCGVPDIFVKKITAVIITLAPFVIYTILGLIILPFIHSAPLFIVAIALFGSHVGGCVGDLYVAATLLFKYRKRKVLMNDNGPTQTFYVKASE